MNKKYAGMTGLFVLLVFGGTVAGLVSHGREFSDRENRYLQQRPQWDTDQVLSGEYQSQYEDYLNDQFPARDALMKLSVYAQKYAGSTRINGVYLGKDGYLLEEPAQIESDQIRENTTILTEFLNQAVKTYGKERVSCVMVPSKTAILPKKLPDHADNGGRQEQEMIAGIRDGLGDPRTLLDLTQTMKEHQDEYIYYRTDHHWTTLGAYYGYVQWAGQTGHTPMKLQQFTRSTAFRDFLGTTYNKLPVETTPDQVELFRSDSQEGVSVVFDGEQRADTLYFPEEAGKGFDRYGVFFSRNTAQIDIQTKAHTGRNLLVLKDSFANCFVPFLTGDYDRILMIDYRYERRDIEKILKEHSEITDILVLYNVEELMEDTHLSALSVRQLPSESMEEFDPDSFMEDF